MRKHEQTGLGFIARLQRFRNQQVVAHGASRHSWLFGCNQATFKLQVIHTIYHPEKNRVMGGNGNHTVELDVRLDKIQPLILGIANYKAIPFSKIS